MALVCCVAALTAWLVTGGKTNTHSLALQHMVHLGQYITLRVVMIHAFVAEHSLRLLPAVLEHGVIDENPTS